MKNGGLNNCSLLWDPLWEFSINLSKYTKSKISDFYNIMFLFGSKYLQWGSFEILWQIFSQTFGYFKHLPKRTLKQMIHHLKIIFYDEHDCLSHFTKQNRISLLGLIGLTLKRLTSERPCQSWRGGSWSPPSILALEPL